MNSPEGSKGDARDIAAKKLGIGSQKAERAVKVIDKSGSYRKSLLCVLLRARDAAQHLFPISVLKK